VVKKPSDAQPGEFKQFGPVLPPPTKLVSQRELKVGSGYNANATASGYTISVYGPCRLTQTLKRASPARLAALMPTPT